MGHTGRKPALWELPNADTRRVDKTRRTRSARRTQARAAPNRAECTLVAVGGGASSTTSPCTASRRPERDTARRVGRAHVDLDKTGRLGTHTLVSGSPRTRAQAELLASSLKSGGGSKLGCGGPARAPRQVENAGDRSRIYGSGSERGDIYRRPGNTGPGGTFFGAHRERRRQR